MSLATPPDNGANVGATALGYPALSQELCTPQHTCDLVYIWPSRLAVAVLSIVHMTPIKFVNQGENGLPRKRKVAQVACDICRRRKVRHYNAALDEQSG